MENAVEPRERRGARLIAINGPASGLAVVVDREVSLGRDAVNMVTVADNALSRRHCTFSLSTGGTIEVRDLGSANGTFVNGEQVERRILAHRDRLTVGESTFMVLVDASDGPDGLDAELDDQLILDKTVYLRAGDSVLLRSDAATHADADAHRAHDMAAVLRIAQTVTATSGSHALQQTVAELLLEVIPADRCVLVVIDATTSELRTAVAKERRPGTRGPIKISRSVVQEALRATAAILVSALERFDRFSESESLLSSGARSVVCAPMKLQKHTVGAIYLDSGKPTGLDETHLQLVTAVASIVAGALEHAQHLEWLEHQNALLESDLGSEHSMVGDSANLHTVHKFIKQVSPTDSTVLVMGESGTGKELVARAIHLRSPRAPRPFIAINCAVLGENLLESELFGHERGAFTGALVQKKGKLELAEGGTLFLDEVGELAPTPQGKLLRVLQEREFERVGGTRMLKADVRVIAATNRDLLQASKAGTFRSDLYYRLNVLTIVMPPLRERAEDIPLLAGHFAAKYGRKCARRIAGLAPEALACLIRYSWPGNIRELENAIERAVVVGTTDLIRPEDLPEAVVESHSDSQSASAPTLAFHEGVREAKKQLITQAVIAARGKYTEAARLLDLHPNYLHMLIRNLDLKDALKKDLFRA